MTLLGYARVIIRLSATLNSLLVITLGGHIRGCSGLDTGKWAHCEIGLVGGANHSEANLSGSDERVNGTGELVDEIPEF